MHRAVPYALAAMVICAAVAVLTSPVDTTQIMSTLGSTFTSATTLSHEFFRRNLTSITIDYSLIDRARVLTVEHLHTARHSVEEALIPCIDAGSRFVTQAIELYHILRSAEAPRPSSPSIESIVYRPQPGPYPGYGSRPQYGSYAWDDVPYCAPPGDPFANPSTLFLMLASSFITAMICISIGSAISISSAVLASLRFAWRCTKALVACITPEPKKIHRKLVPLDSVSRRTKAPLMRLAAKSEKIWDTDPAPEGFVWRRTNVKVPRTRPAPKLGKPWGTLLAELILALANVAAGLIKLLYVCLAGLLFYISDIVLWAINRHNGRKLRVPPPPQVIYQYMPDPRVPKLQEEQRSLHDRMQHCQDLLENTRIRYDADTGELLAENESLRFTVQGLEEEKQRSASLRKEIYLATEKKKDSDARSAKQLSDRDGTIRTLKSSLWAEQREHAALQKLHASCQGHLNAKDEDCRYWMERILDLEENLEAVQGQNGHIRRRLFS